jgi:hypothetical protein
MLFVSTALVWMKTINFITHLTVFTGCNLRITDLFLYILDFQQTCIKEITKYGVAITVPSVKLHDFTPFRIGSDISTQHRLKKNLGLRPRSAMQTKLQKFLIVIQILFKSREFNQTDNTLLRVFQD